MLLQYWYQGCVIIKALNDYNDLVFSCKFLQIFARQINVFPVLLQSQTESSQQKTPVGRKRKRRRLKDSDLSDLLSPDSPLFQSKRRSKDALSLSTSLLDCSLVSPATPNGITQSSNLTPKTLVPIAPPKPVTARHQVALELLQTEKNYVEILTTILKVLYCSQAGSGIKVLSAKWISTTNACCLKIPCKLKKLTLKYFRWAVQFSVFDQKY